MALCRTFLLALFALGVLSATPAKSAPLFTYEGYLEDVSGPVNNPTQAFVFEVYGDSGSGSCLFYSETQTLAISGGHFSAQVGKGSSPTYPASAETPPVANLWQVFEPGVKTSGACSFDPSLPAAKRFLRVRLWNGASYVNMSNIEISQAPRAIMADRVGGYRPDQLVRVEAGGLTPLTAGEYSTLSLFAQTGSAPQAAQATSVTGSFSGDVTGTQSAMSVERLRGRTVSATAPSGGQVLKWTGTEWAPSSDDSGPGGTVTGVSASSPLSSSGGVSPNLSLVAGTAEGQVLRWNNGSSLWQSTKLRIQDLTNNAASTPIPAGSCASGEFLIWQSANDRFECSALTGPMLTAALGYTPMNPASNLGDVASAASARSNLGFLSGLEASRPGSAQAGRLYITTDTQRIFYDTGATWILVGTSLSGTVTSVGSANADLSVSNPTTTPQLTVNTGTGANQILKLNASSEIPAVSGANLTALNASNLGSGTVPDARMPALSGDAIMAAGTTATTVARIRGNNVAATTPLEGQVYRWNNGATQWEPVYFGVDDLRTAAGVSQFSASCAASQTLTWSAVSDAFTCANIAGLDASTISSGVVDNARLPASATAWQPATGGVNYAAGNVGMGTATPQQRLDVAGAIRVSGGTFQGASTARTTTDGGPIGPVVTRSFMATTTVDGTVLFETPNWRLEKTANNGEFRLVTKTAINLSYWARSGSSNWGDETNIAGTAFLLNAGTNREMQIFFGQPFSAVNPEFTHVVVHRYGADYFWVGYLVSNIVN